MIQGYPTGPLPYPPPNTTPPSYAGYCYPYPFPPGPAGMSPVMLNPNGGWPQPMMPFGVPDLLQAQVPSSETTFEKSGQVPTNMANVGRGTVTEANEAHDWPNGFQHREQRAGDPQTKKLFKENKWVWASHGNVLYNGYRAERRRCQGVLQCFSCTRITRPTTSPISGQVGVTCQMPQCMGTLQHQACNVFSYHFNVTQDGEVFHAWDHVGHHEHPRAPGGRLTEHERMGVLEQVYRNQNASAESAHQLCTGDIGVGSVPLAKIAPKLANPRSSRYHVNEAKAQLGITVSPSKSSSGALHSWKELQEKLEDPFIIDSSIHGSTIYITLQTPFMKQMLHESVDMWHDDAQEDTLGSSRHGCITDGDHTFFRAANLLATCVFNPDLVAWMPVLYTYMDGLDVNHHRPHFKHLFREICNHAGPRFNREMLIHVRIH